MNSMRTHDTGHDGMSTGSKTFRLVLLIFCLVGAALVVVSTSRYGAAVECDEAFYISGARNLVSGKGLVDFKGAPWYMWPPLYPVLLASVSFITRLDPHSCAAAVNAVLFGVIIWLSGLLLARFVTRSYTLLFLGVALVVFSRVLVRVAVSAASETAFICCILLFLVAARSYAARASIPSLAGMSLAAALACLLRWPGLILIPAGILCVLPRRDTTSKTKLLHALSLFLISAVPIGLWVTVGSGAGHFLSQALQRGPRSSLATSLLESLRLVAKTVLSWYARLSLHGLGPIETMSSLALVLVLSVAVLVLLRRTGITRLWPSMVAILRGAAPLLVFIALYTALIVFSHVTARESIDNRLLSPIYVPVTVLLFAFLDRSFELLRATPFGRNARSVVLCATVFWSASAVSRVGFDSIDRIRYGAGGCSTVAWRESPTIGAVERLDLNEKDVVYSNAPYVLYFLAHIPAEWSPWKMPYDFKTITAVSRLKGTWPRSTAYLVWFDKIANLDQFTIDDLREIARLDPIARLEDGAIYAVTKE